MESWVDRAVWIKIKKGFRTLFQNMNCFINNKIIKYDYKNYIISIIIQLFEENDLEGFML